MHAIVTVFFYVFAFIMLASAIMVISARNPVHSVLFLILAFFNGAALFLLTGAEFVGFMVLIVYVGAVAVLFLFVVMMLDVDFAELKQGVLQYAPVGGLIGLIIAIELIGVIVAQYMMPTVAKTGVAPIDPKSELSNTEMIGHVLYTDYVFYFQIAGLILLVAMIGAILLTMQHRKDVKRQSIAQQVARGKDAIEIKKVESGKGI